MAVKRKKGREETGVGEATPISRREFFLDQLRKKFMTLSKEQKDLIREAKAAGLEWKGEDTQTRLPQLGNLTHFEHVFTEYKKMREVGIDAYREKALALLDTFAGRNLDSNV